MSTCFGRTGSLLFEVPWCKLLSTFSTYTIHPETVLRKALEVYYSLTNNLYILQIETFRPEGQNIHDIIGRVKNHLQTLSIVCIYASVQAGGRSELRDPL